MKQQLDAERPQVEIACPHCGGASRWDLLQHLNQCSYCGSVLSWPYSEGEPDYLVAESVISKDEELIDVIGLYDAMREASRRRMPQGNTRGAEVNFELGGGFSDTDVYDIKRERAHLFRLQQKHCIYAPYQLFCTLLGFQVLGRTSAEQKVFQPMFFLSEAIVPGYSEDWNFRDKGLQLSKQNLKPLTLLTGSEPFLAVKKSGTELDELTRHWTNQRKLMEPEIHPICFQGRAVESRKWWVYRPYYYVQASTPEGIQWFLIDAQFRTIAGMPESEETLRAEKGKWKKLDLKTVRKFDVKIVPFRCPECGWDMKLQKGEYQLCDNCSRVLEVSGQGLAVQPYQTLQPEQLKWWPKGSVAARAWLPFWRVRLSVLFEKKRYEDFGELMTQVLPGVEFAKEAGHFYVPAFECWTVARYDRWAFQFASALSEIKELPGEALLQAVRNKNDFVIPMVVPKKTCASLFPGILPMYTSNRAQARMNAMVIKRLEAMAVLIRDQNLVFIPAALNKASGADIRLLGPAKPIEWLPLKEGVWPPTLHRTVRRWMSLDDAPKTKARTDLDWLNKRLS